MDDTLQFFQSLWPDPDTQGYIAVWNKNRTFWHKISDTDITQSIRDLERYSDVYFGVGLQQEPMSSPYQRGGSSTVVAIPGFWVDLDIGPHDTDKVYPPTREDGLLLLKSLGYEPSIIIDSGGGYHAYWLLDEPFLTPTQVERDEADLLSRRWQASLRAQAETHGWTIDSTHDLARVLRVPGTTNHKYNLPVSIVHIDENTRFSLDELEERMIDINYVPGVLDQVSDNLILSPTANVNQSQFMRLYSSNPTFSSTWDLKRTDFKDQSPSTYDLSIASQAIIAGWTDQDVCNLIITFRREHGFDLKLRLDYYVRTIARAKESKGRQDADAFFNNDTSDGPPDKDGILDHISHELQIRVNKIIKYDAADPQYRMETEYGIIPIGGVADILGAEKFRCNVARVSSIVIPSTITRRTRWDNLAQAILQIAEPADVGDEATERGVIFEWVSSYLEDNPPSVCNDEDERNVIAATHLPYIWDEYIYISLAGDVGLDSYMIRRRGKLSRKELVAMIHSYGFVQERVTWRDDLLNKVVSRRYWGIAKERLADDSTN